MADPRRLVHLTTVDMSLELLLGTELDCDVAAGWDTYAMSAPGPYVQRLTARGVHHLALPSFTRRWSLRADLSAARELYRELRRLRPDVLHTHTPKAGVLGRILGRLAGVPVVVHTCHGLWASREDPVAKRAAVYGAEALAGAFADAELYQNADDRETMRRWSRRGRSAVVGNGIDLDRFRRDDAAGRRLRQEWGIAPDTLVVGGVGRVVAEKGIVELAQTARSLAGKAEFVWVGPADEDKPDALTLDGGTGLRFVGARDDMDAVYSAFDVFVLPSYREGFSRSAMEAAACGCALVLSDIRGCRELGRHDRDLLLVPPGDPETLTGAVESLLVDADRRRRLQGAAEAAARRRFDQRRVAAASLRTYEIVARRKGLRW